MADCLPFRPVEERIEQSFGKSLIFCYDCAKSNRFLKMTITKEIPAEQVRSLDLHQGDSLHVVAEMGGNLIIQIVKAASPAALSRKQGKAGAWARKYAGALKGAESLDEARMSHYHEKYGI